MSTPSYDDAGNLALSDCGPHFLLIFSVPFALAMIFRFIVLWQVAGDPNINHLGGDGLAYWRWADSILSGNWFGSQVFYQSPLYPYFLAIVRKLLALHESGVRILQICLGSLSCGILAIAVRRLISPWTGLIAGLMLALYPACISFDLQIDKPVLDALLMSAMVWSIAQLTDRATARRWLVCGIICGVFSLSRENGMVLLIALIGWIWFGFPAVLRSQRIRLAGGLLGGAIIVLAPVAIRNSVVGHGLYGTTAQFGPNFYIGNNATADGIYQPLRPNRGDAAYERVDAIELAENATHRALTPGEVSRFWAGLALHDIASDPARWAKLMARKFVMIFADTELADSDVHDRFIAWSPILRALDSVFGFGALFTLATAGVILSWDIRGRLAVLWILIAAFAIATSFFFIFARYRLPLVPLMICSAAFTLAHLPMLARKRGFVVLLGAGVSIGLVALGECAIPQRIRGTNAYNRAEVFGSRGQSDLAESYYRLAIQQNPNLAAAYNNLGLLLADESRLKEADSLLSESVKLDPADPAAQINLGMVLARQGKLDPAIDHLRAARSLDPHNSAATYNLAAALMLQGKKSQAIELLNPIASDRSDPFSKRATALLANRATTRS